MPWPSIVDINGTKRVLIYRLGSLGDTVVAVPALHLVALAFPSARRVLLTNTPVHAKAPAAWAVLEGSNLVHGCISYPVGLRGVVPLARLWLSIRRFRPQLVVYLAKPRGREAIRRDVWFFRICGVSRIIGLPVGELSEARYFPEAGLWERESARLLRSIRELDDSSEGTPNWDLLLTEQEKDAARAELAAAADAPLIVCGPGTKMQAKDWGRENWRQLLTRLSAALPGPAALALVGAKEDAPVAEYAASGWEGTVVNLCGLLNPRQTAAALIGAELFLGPDSGPMHLAAAMGVPCAIAFAARTKPGIWFPAGDRNRIVYHQTDCADCNLETCVEQKRKCLTSITVDEMLAAALEAWSEGRKERSANAV